MNIEQIKADLNNNVIVSRETWHKLVEAALIMQADLLQISTKGLQVGALECEISAQVCLERVEAL